MLDMLFRTRGALVAHRAGCEFVDGELIPWTFSLGRTGRYLEAVAARGTTYCAECKPLEGRDG